MKKTAKFTVIISIILALVTMFSIHVIAAEETESVYIDGVGTFYYTVTDNEVTIVECKASSYNLSIVIPETFEGATVTKIGNNAFRNETRDFLKIVLPDTITHIGDYAFYDNWAEINVPASLQYVGTNAFYNCYHLTTTELPNTLTTIGSGAFYNCDSIENLNFSDSLESIGSWAFEECDGIKEVTFPDSIDYIGSAAFRECLGLQSVTIPDMSNGLIDGSAFNGCKSLKTVTIGNFDNSTLGRYAFSGCTSLESVTFGDVANLTIPTETFQNCTSLKSINFGKVKGVTINDNAFKALPALETLNFESLEDGTIGAYAFSECTALKEFDFNGFVSVGEYAFSKTGLVNINTPKNITFGKYVFSECPDLVTAVINGEGAEYLFSDCPALKEVTLTSCKTIPLRMFEDCSVLEKVTAESVMTVGNCAFINCKALKTFDFTNVTKINSASFRNCESLDNIDISKFTDIPSYAFYGCTTLKNLGDCKPKNIGDYAFYGCEALETVDFSKTDTIGEYAFAKSGLINVDLSSQYCGAGRRAFQACNNLKELYFKYDVFLGEEVFADCEGLESIIIGDDVEFIGGMYQSNGYYFADCNNVKYFYIGKNFKDTHNEEAYCIFDFDLHTLGGLEAFEVSPENSYFFTDDNGVLYMNTTYKNTDLVVLVSYPAGRTNTFYSTENALKNSDRLFSIGDRAFCDQKNLKELELTKTVVGNLADEIHDENPIYFVLEASFAYSSIEKITFTDDCYFDEIGYLMFWKSNIRDINLNGVKTIFESGFEDCLNLTSVSSDTCEYIYELAFNGCNNLKSVSFPNCADIYARAFENCTSLENISFPKIYYIGNSAFEDCINLPATLELKTVEIVGSYAFEGCTKITTVIFPECSEIECYAFLKTNLTKIILGSVHVYEYAFAGCTTLTTVEADNVSFIGNDAFNGCVNLESVKTSSVGNISDKAFYNCAKLKEFYFESAKSIGRYAFYGCELLEIINLTSVESVGSNAFENCTNLKLVQFSQDTCNFGTNCFKNCPDVSFYCEEDTDPYNYAIKNNIPVSAITVVFEKTAYEYTGSEIEPSVIVSISGMALTQNVDYTLTFEKNVGCGNGRLTVKFIGDFEGLPDAVRLFSIIRADITKAKVEYVVDNEYTGEEIRPKVVVKYGDKTLVEDVDYTIKYNSGTNAGSMFFTINGKGNYQGSLDCYYNIIRCDIAEATVVTVPDMVYTGEQLKPKPVLEWKGFTLIENEDYEIRYFDNIESGYGTMAIYGMGNFCGTQRVQFKIFGKNIENAVVSEIPDQIYTGNQITPDVTVTLGDLLLVKDTDYVLKYENNIEKGVATVLVSGIGNYSGVAKQTFNINKNSVYSFTVFSETEMTETYNGTPLKPEMEVYYGTTRLTEDVDYRVVLENNVNAGTATVTIIGMGVYEGERSYNFTILPCEILEGDVSVTGNGATEPEITIVKNGETLVNGKDFTVAYSNNNGTGTATINGIGNYCETVEVEYTITEDDNQPDNPNGDNGNENGDENEEPGDNGNDDNGGKLSFWQRLINFFKRLFGIK